MTILTSAIVEAGLLRNYSDSCKMVNDHLGARG